MTHAAIVALSALAVAGQVLVGGGLLAGLAALLGVRGPLRAVRRALRGFYQEPREFAAAMDAAAAPGVWGPAGGGILDRLPDLHQAGEVQRLQSLFINGVKHLPVAFTPSAPVGA